MFDLEIRKPSREAIVGFVLTWVCVVLIMLLTLVVTRIGA